MFAPRDRVRTGDISFDVRATVRGPSAVAFAVLTPLVRARLGPLLDIGSASLRDGVLTIVHPKPSKTAELVEWIEDAIDLFERMVYVDLAERLLANLESEPSSLPRERILAILLREGRQPVRDEAIQRCLDDPWAPTRLLAVKALKSGGWDECIRFLEIGPPPYESAALLRHMALTFGRERMLPYVEAALEERRPIVVEAAIEAAGGWRAEALLPRLTLLAGGSRSETKSAVAHALGRIGGPSAESTLLRMIRDSDREVRRAAVDALGRAGTLEVIGVLSQVREHALRRHLKDAIAAIQARCGKKHEGALSLSTEGVSEGAVSVSNEAGRMSLDEG